MERGRLHHSVVSSHYVVRRVGVLYSSSYVGGFMFCFRRQLRTVKTIATLLFSLSAYYVWTYLIPQRLERVFHLIAQLHLGGFMFCFRRQLRRDYSHAPF
jgi:hypothetical protein